MLIILDSSILVEDFRLNSLRFRLLLGATKRTGHSLALPEIVFLEVCNKFGEALDKEWGRVWDGTQKIERMVGRRLKPPMYGPDVTRAKTSYCKYLRRALLKAGATFLPIPSTGHKEIIERDLARRKPFAVSGKGYRDTLIWQSLLTAALGIKEQVAFISCNTKDFADESGQLHYDLQRDLKDAKLSGRKVVFFASLHKFLSEHVIPKLPTAERTVVEFLKANGEDHPFEYYLCDALGCALVEYSERDPDDLGLPSEFESVTIGSVQNVSNVEVQSEAKEEGTSRILDISATATCEFDFFIFKSEYYAMTDKDSKDLHITDHDWNDHYIAVSKLADVKLRAYVTIDTHDWSVTAVDVYSMNAPPADVEAL